MKKRQTGQYYTWRNPFDHVAFRSWAKLANLLNEIVLEPFAGSNSIIKMLRELVLCKDFVSYDIQPKSKSVRFKDTLKSFPKGFRVAVSNPPYLAKNSAKRRGICFPQTTFDDLYKHALSICLYNVQYLAVIIPASFLNSNLFLDRLSTYIALPYKDMFTDTECPVCLALFEPKQREILIYEKEKYIGRFRDLMRYLPKKRREVKVRFNDKHGELGFVAIDDNIKPSIRFFHGEEIESSRVKYSSRNITRIGLSQRVSHGLIEDLNGLVGTIREKTADVFLTPFKGVRKDGRFRRRMEFGFAKDILLAL